jgi:hypothetical protein
MHDWIEVASDAFAVHFRSAEEGRILVLGARGGSPG